MNLDPLYDLRLETERLVLQWPTEDDLLALARLAEAGVHPPEQMPFLVPWTDPSPTFISDFVAFHQSLRAGWRPDDWKLELAVFADGELIGVQGIHAQDFQAKRSVTTGSWLGIAFQSRGFGTEMRLAVLSLAFDGLGAAEARTAAMADNIASQRVSQKLGYRLAGEQWPVIRGRPKREFTYRLTRAAFAKQNLPHAQITGLDECRELLGATS